MLGYDVPENGHYLVLEAINTEEIMRKKTKIIHIVDFKNFNTLILGRGNEAHVKISDISISRNHALLKIINNKEIWLEDFQSKFGSLMIHNDPYEITPKSGVETWQIGRTLMTITCQYPKSCCCFKPIRMTRGFPISSYSDDFPLGIRELVVPKKILIEKEKDSSDGNHDFIEYSEKITNSNLLDTNFINNIGKYKGDHWNENSKLIDKEPIISVRKIEERK